MSTRKERTDSTDSILYSLNTTDEGTPVKVQFRDKHVMLVCEAFLIKLLTFLKSFWLKALSFTDFAAERIENQALAALQQ